MATAFPKILRKKTDLLSSAFVEGSDSGVQLGDG